MASEEDVGTFAGRLATFERIHHFAKRRASSTKKKAQTSVTWPHQTPTPEDLARAGFYYKPSTSSLDSVSCFLCDKALDGWEAGDDPVDEHISHVPNCGWAMNVCIEQRNQKMDRAEEDPNNERMQESRRSTFRDAWPHEGRKGWKCKTQKMVEAGWCYAPLPEADDCVHCFYCGVSLDGWEPKDDPWEEHRRRAPECHFFTLVDEAKKTGHKAAKGRARAGSRASKASRMSTQSNMTFASEAPSMLDDEFAEDEDTVLTTTSKATKGGKKSTKKTSSKRTKGTKSKILPIEPSSPPADEQIDDALLKDLASPEPEEPMPKPTKARGKRAPKESAAHAEDIEESVIEIPPPTRKVSRTKKAAKQPEGGEDFGQIAAKLDADNSVLVKGATRATRGKKRTSDGTEKADISVLTESMPLPPKGRTIAGKKQRERERNENEVAEADSKVVPPPVAKPGVEEPMDFDELPPPRPRATSKAKPARSVSAQQASNSRSEGSDVVVVIPQATKPLAKPEAQKHIQLASTPGRSISTKIIPPVSALSPQSSDAENVPPSSRPSFTAAGAMEVARVPLAATTPRMSPSKRNIIAGGLSTVHPWTAVDLESIFLPSPRGQKGEQENTLARAFQRLTSPEKKMSVEEWILWNAQSAEVKLKGECERLIGIFEGEGNRALRSLEGIQTAE